MIFDLANFMMGTTELAAIKDIELRDWFTGQALAGLLASPQLPPQSSEEPFDQFAGRITDRAYRIADAMLKEGQRYKKWAGNGSDLTQHGKE